VFLSCPQPPDWSIDWPSLDPLPWLQEMRGCPQNPDRHAEGDVWNHVHLVAEAMIAMPAWRESSERDRRILFAAALLHDVAKPACTRTEPDGRLTARGHSWRGAVKARNILWRLGMPFADREAVCAIIRHHLVPFFLADSQYPDRMAVEVSQTARCDHLAIMAEADVRGRICPDPQKLLTQIARFRDRAEKVGCLNGSFEFPSEQARFLYFRDPSRSAGPLGPAEFPCHVVLLSGLPSAGKDYWLERNLPDWAVVSPDAIRHSLGIPPSDPQGTVLNQARDMAREFLQNRTNFVWNAPNLSRNIRGECIRLLHEFGAHVRLVYVEVPTERLFAQNRQRRRRVPEKVIERLLDRWEVPDRTEAHRLEYVVD
jgi:predicted kinase